MGMGGMSALTGLGGYVGLGGKVAIPVGTSMMGEEVLLARDGELSRVSSVPADIAQILAYSSRPRGTTHVRNHYNGQVPRKRYVNSVVQLKCLSLNLCAVFSNPYIYAVVPVVPTSSSSSSSTASTIHAHAIQIHLAATLARRDSIALPAPSTGALTIGNLAAVTSTNVTTPAEEMLPSTKILLISTPTDKALSQSEGSSLWALRSGEVGQQIDDLVKEGRVSDAIGLVEAVGEAGLSPVRGFCRPLL